MKTLLIFLIFLSLFGCNNIIKNKQTLNNFNCPKVFFSPEDRVFIDTISNSSSLDDVSVKAEINNFAIVKNCYQQNDVAMIPLEILIIAEPMEKLENSDISMPIYAILLDKNDEILETQYFMISASINKNFETKLFLETDIIDELSIVTNNLETEQIVIGFMLNNKQRLFLN